MSGDQKKRKKPKHGAGGTSSNSNNPASTATTRKDGDAKHTQEEGGRAHTQSVRDGKRPARGQDPHGSNPKQKSDGNSFEPLQNEDSDSDEDNSDSDEEGAVDNNDSAGAAAGSLADDVLGNLKGQTGGTRFAAGGLIEQLLVKAMEKALETNKEPEPWVLKMVCGQPVQDPQVVQACCFYRVIRSLFFWLLDCMVVLQYWAGRGAGICTHLPNPLTSCVYPPCSRRGTRGLPCGGVIARNAPIQCCSAGLLRPCFHLALVCRWELRPLWVLPMLGPPEVYVPAVVKAKLEAVQTEGRTLKDVEEEVVSLCAGEGAILSTAKSTRCRDGATDRVDMKKLICTRGGKSRHLEYEASLDTAPGVQRRNVKGSARTGCPFEVSVRHAKSHRWPRISNMKLTHNHSVDREAIDVKLRKRRRSARSTLQQL
ncbi:unnamed protein product [Ectocarpus sp. CCAP 1310/34]|nr:unnamed protein product [Ectocarpus sp. CCAP 1310/34]